MTLAAISAWAAGLAFFHLLCVAASRRMYIKRPPERPLVPFTVVKPMKGLDVGLEENLRALLEADLEGKLQVLFAIESAKDPAYPVAKRVADAFQDRDVELVLTGPSGGRMGKIHNMIEALPKARHGFVVFSDADVLVDRAALLETSRLFEKGADAVYATPCIEGPGTVQDFLMAVAVNHFLALPGALTYRLGLFQSFSGAWMGFRREVLRELGDLRPFERHIVDDFTIGDAVRRSGKRIELSRRVVVLREKSGTFAETVEHLNKWLRVVRHALPWVYLLIPAVNVSLASVLAGLAWLAAGRAEIAAAAVGAGFAVRILSAFLQDRSLVRGRFSPAMYLLLPGVDLAEPALWLAAIFSRRVSWRGKSYKMVRGGKIEVLS